MSDDLIDDPEWLELLAGFRQHFWESRVPTFRHALAEVADLPLSSWPQTLKATIHGLAGVAALVDMETVGNLARHIEQRWDAGDAESALRSDLAQLAALLDDGPGR